MSLVLVTTCCAAKRTDPQPLPARERYLDRRLALVGERAAARGVPWLILSGEFGLLEPTTPIPWYDHALRGSEVPALAERVADRLRELGTTEVELQTVPVADDPGLAPYIRVMGLACASAGVVLRHVEDPGLAG